MVWVKANCTFQWSVLFYTVIHLAMLLTETDFVMAKYTHLISLSICCLPTATELNGFLIDSFHIK